MCEYVTHPEHWPGDQGDVVAALGDQCRRGTITIRYGDQPYGGVLSSYDMVVLDPAFIRVPDERAWLVRPERGRPYLEVEVWALDADGRPRILDGDAVIEPARRTVWID